MIIVCDVIICIMAIYVYQFIDLNQFILFFYQMSGNMENRLVPAYVMEILGLTAGEQSHLMAVRGAKRSADPVSTVAHGFKHLDHRPPTMRTSVNDNKYCLDDHHCIVYVLTKYERLPQVLDKRIVFVGDY